MSALDTLRNDSFEQAAHSISTAEGARAFLGARREVIDIRRALTEGSITTDDVRAFVRELLTDFKGGKRFSGDLVLAAIAVAVESLPGQFADNFLKDLSMVEASETPLAPRVAVLALHQRQQSLTGVTLREMTISTLVPDRRVRITESIPIPISGDVLTEQYRLAS